MGDSLEDITGVGVATVKAIVVLAFVVGLGSVTVSLLGLIINLLPLAA